jgi:hypothetical protein
MRSDIGSERVKLYARQWRVVILCVLATSLLGDEPLIPMLYEASWITLLPSASWQGDQFIVVLGIELCQKPGTILMALLASVK